MLAEKFSRFVCMLRGHTFGGVYKREDNINGYRDYPTCSRCKKVINWMYIEHVNNDEQSES